MPEKAAHTPGEQDMRLLQEKVREAAAEITRFRARVKELEGALQPVTQELEKQTGLLWHRARNSTAGVAREFIERAQKWELLCSRARAVLNSATR